MAASGLETSGIAVGGKGSSLSSTSVYAVSRGLCKVRIDSSALEKLSPSNKTSPLSTFAVISPGRPRFLTLEESRATLVVVLNKLVLSDAGVRPTLPRLIEDTLNLGSRLETLDFGSSLGFLNTLCQLSGKNLEEVGATSEEVCVLEHSLTASIGICAILDCTSSALSRVLDAVAALSCEAARADVAAFDLPSSGDGFSDKDMADVAGDMKVLLFGSKLIGQTESQQFSDIPRFHSSFRKAVRALHVQIRVELNSTVVFRKKTVSRINGLEETLAALASSLAMSIEMAGKSSLGRVASIVRLIDNPDLQSRLVGVFERDCPNDGVLKDGFPKVWTKADSEPDYVAALHQVYQLLVKFREILAWEAALALFVLEMDESIEKPQAGSFSNAETNGGNVKGERRSEKKRKKTLGKGTSVLRQLIRDRLVTLNGMLDVSILVKWVQDLFLYFDPKDVELDTLLGKIKDIVESNEVRRLPKIPKGTRDFGKEQMAIRERAFSIILGVFKRHGAVSLDTPVFELRETLMGKYGEDSKLIYDLADQGGEICSLRYDLTVPFARYVAMNNINALKRYQIAKVYRRDNPSKGRYREFYQCDFDIAGQYEAMGPDFEVIKVLTELLDELNIGDYEIKLNHRKLLDGMFDICGVSSEKFRTVCSSIDKLDKQTFEQIKKELVEDKGLSVETAEKIGSFVKKRGPPLEILSDLKKDGSKFLENDGSVAALKDLEILFKALEKAKSLDRVVFDLSLARGLDYYTGVIFEAVFKGATQVGSIAAGGRYDNLVGMFSGKQVPAVGISLGIERVFTIMEQLEKDRNQVIRATETEVLVAVLGNDLALAVELASEMWAAKIKAEFGLHKKVMKLIDRAVQSGIPWLVLVGEEEQRQGIVKLKDIKANKEEVVTRDTIVEVLQRRLND